MHRLATRMGAAETPVTLYDHIIIGAGSAGCVLANRLSANLNTTVFLIEAGPRDTNRLIHMPKGYLRTHRDPQMVWYSPVTAEADRGEWQGSLIAGKVLGGSSSINSMLYVRGQPQDYDDWAASGAPGWGWKDLAPCFKKIEDHELGASDTRGSGGPLHISSWRPHDQVCDAILAAGVEMGLRRKADLNEADQEGIGYFPVTIKNGRRVSAATAFLAPIRKRANLSVMTDAMATKIIFNGRRAVGVRCVRNGVAHEFQTRREIILSAGALQSPKLLQLSGIGPADHLRSLGIAVVFDRCEPARTLEIAAAISSFATRGSQPSPARCSVRYQSPSVLHIWQWGSRLRPGRDRRFHCCRFRNSRRLSGTRPLHSNACPGFNVQHFRCGRRVAARS